VDFAIRREVPLFKRNVATGGSVTRKVNIRLAPMNAKANANAIIAMVPFVRITITHEKLAKKCKLPGSDHLIFFAMNTRNFNLTHKGKRA
jgi:hypothetical protein